MRGHQRAEFPLATTFYAYNRIYTPREFGRDMINRTQVFQAGKCILGYSQAFDSIDQRPDACRICGYVRFR